MFDKDVLALPGSHKLIGMLVINSVLQTICIILQGLLLSWIITCLWHGYAWQDAAPMMLKFGIVFLLHYGFDAWRDKLLIEYARQQAEDLRTKLIKKVFQLGPVIIREKGTGNVVTMAMEGIDQVEDYLRLFLSKAVDMMIVPLGILIVTFYLNWVAGIILLLAFPLIILFMIILGQAAKRKADTQYAIFQQLANHFMDSIRGLRTLKQLGISKSYEKSIYTASERFRKTTMNTLLVALTSSFALDFFTTLSIAIMAVYLGFRLLSGHILLFPALAALILSPEYFAPIKNFGDDYHATLNGKNAFAAINQILNIKVSRNVPVKLAPWDAQTELNIQNLSVNYGEQPALADFNLTVHGMQKIGIVGLSGSGKSTLINILSGFMRPQAGHIQINNHRITSFAQTDWQKQLLYIPQKPYIFQMSLRDNICFYTPGATTKQVEQAVHAVGLDELVDQLPAGLDTLIGEGARPLSGGQAQRIALARAFLDQNRHIMLLDEPTAHLDIETELALKERMLPLMDHHLVFLATHRLHWLKQMDYIVVLRQGEIAEQGTLAELLHHEGELKRLLREMQPA